LCALTDGNLSRHLQVLHDAGLVEVWKGAQGGRPQTLCRLTAVGRRRLLEYIAVLENVVADALGVQKDVPAADGPLTEGLSPA
jgi:predicted ArsR family transcriptional regulator